MAGRHARGAGGAFAVSFAGSYPAYGQGIGVVGATHGGFAITAGILSPSDLLPNADGVIPAIAHALRFTVPCANNYPGNVNSRATYGGVYPSIAELSTDGPCPESIFEPYYGARIQFTMTPDEIKKLKVAPYVKTILTALHTYGAYLTDTGSGTNGIGLAALSGLSYTQPPGGAANPWAVLAAANDIAPSGSASPWNVYHLPLDLSATGIANIGTYLQVIHPCVTAARLAPETPTFGKCSY